MVVEVVVELSRKAFEEGSSPPGVVLMAVPEPGECRLTG